VNDDQTNPTTGRSPNRTKAADMKKKKKKRSDNRNNHWSIIPFIPKENRQNISHELHFFSAQLNMHTKLKKPLKFRNGKERIKR